MILKFFATLTILFLSIFGTVSFALSPLTCDQLLKKIVHPDRALVEKYSELTKLHDLFRAYEKAPESSKHPATISIVKRKIVERTQEYLSLLQAELRLYGVESKITVGSVHRMNSLFPTMVLLLDREQLKDPYFRYLALIESKSGYHFVFDPNLSLLEGITESTAAFESQIRKEMVINPTFNGTADFRALLKEFVPHEFNHALFTLLEEKGKGSPYQLLFKGSDLGGDLTGYKERLTGEELHNYAQDLFQMVRANQIKKSQLVDIQVKLADTIAVARQTGELTVAAFETIYPQLERGELGGIMLFNNAVQIEFLYKGSVQELGSIVSAKRMDDFLKLKIDRGVIQAKKVIYPILGDLDFLNIKAAEVENLCFDLLESSKELSELSEGDPTFIIKGKELRQGLRKLYELVSNKGELVLQNQ